VKRLFLTHYVSSPLPGLTRQSIAQRGLVSKAMDGAGLRRAEAACCDGGHAFALPIYDHRETLD
jgi:hypothetical protein